MASKGRKLKAFKPAWLDKRLKDCDCKNQLQCDCEASVPVRDFFTADPSNPQNAKCLSCPTTPKMPFGRTFNIGEGFTAIQKHSNTQEHRKHKTGGKLNHAEQLSIQAAIQNQEEITEKSRKEQDQLLKSQILFANFVHSHSLPSETFTCFSDLVDQIFPDSPIAKRWASPGEGMRRTKGDYFLYHGIYLHLQEELIEKLRTSHFCLNIDESSVNKSTQLDINVSFGKGDQAVKEHLTTISMEEGTKAEDIVDAVFSFLDSLLIPLSNIVDISTDGCYTMIGEVGGVHALMRQRLPHLPFWGGCNCHDCSNILKAGVTKLDPNITELYSRLHTYLSSGSLHRKREYEDFCRKRGLEPHTIPKFFEVRFRTITSCAIWMEKDHRCLYNYFSQLASDVKDGKVKDLTATESFILKHFSSKIILVRLTNQFIIDVSEPIMKLINHFESEEPNIYSRFEILVDFLTTFMAKFLKNGGLEEGQDLVTAKTLLGINVADRNIQLSNMDMFVGPKAEEFIKQLGLTKQSTELIQFFDHVRAFYCEALQKAQKYFRPSLSSKLLRYCEIFDPKVFYTMSLDDLKRKIQYVADKFPNVVKPIEVPGLLDLVASLRGRSRAREAATVYQPFKFFTVLLTWQEGKYKLIGKLGRAILVIYGASTSAERDFSVMNSLVTDPSRNRTSQLRLQARLRVKSNTHSLKHSCQECLDAKERKRSREQSEEEVNESDLSEDEDSSDEEPKRKRRRKDELEETNHCHCSRFVVDDKLLASMKDGQPWRRFIEESERKRAQASIDKQILARRKEEDDRKIEKDLQTELQRLRRHVREETRRKDLPQPEKPTFNKKAELEEKRREKEKERQAKKAELFLLFS